MKIIVLEEFWVKWGRKMISKLFNIENSDLVVMIGGGGKTSMINRLADELLADGKRVILTTSTKIFPPSAPPGTVLLKEQCDHFYPAVRSLIQSQKFAVLGSRINHLGKIIGLSPEEIDFLKSGDFADIILVEGDGARNKPFKAPRMLEPVIPETATLVVPVVGIDCLGKPLTENDFFAVEEICRLTGLSPGEKVMAEDIVRVMLSPAGFWKNVPPGARWIPFINKVDGAKEREQALFLARLLKENSIEKVVIGSTAKNIYRLV